jgi:hypothetical protein
VPTPAEHHETGTRRRRLSGEVEGLAMNRTGYLLIVLFTVLTTSLWAQDGYTGYVLFEDGERIEYNPEARDPLETLAFSLLDSPKDGRCEVFENATLVMALTKKGDELVISDGAQDHKMSVQQAKENFISAKAKGQLIACKSNLKNLGTALEMYAVDHEESYPKTLVPLTPDYLLALPTCPTGNGTAVYNYQLQPGTSHFELQCQGDHSKVGVERGLPAYDSEKGIIAPPVD